MHWQSNPLKGVQELWRQKDWDVKTLLIVPTICYNTCCWVVLVSAVVMYRFMHVILCHIILIMMFYRPTAAVTSLTSRHTCISVL